MSVKFSVTCSRFIQWSQQFLAATQITMSSSLFVSSFTVQQVHTESLFREPEHPNWDLIKAAAAFFIQ